MFRSPVHSYCTCSGASRGCWLLYGAMQLQSMSFTRKAGLVSTALGSTLRNPPSKVSPRGLFRNVLKHAKVRDGGKIKELVLR